MIFRFPSYESAAIAVGKLRSEGYFAEVCDDCVAHLWGPVATGGVRIIVSEEPVEIEDSPPPPSPQIEALFAIARATALCLMLIAGGVFALIVLQLAILQPISFIVFVVILGVAAIASVFVMAAISIAWSRFLANSLLRTTDATSASSNIVCIIALYLILFMILF